MACLSSSVPPAFVYLVKLWSIASIAARLIFSGVGKSGSPALKSTTSAPLRRKRSASAATFMVDDTLIVEILPASSCNVSIESDLLKFTLQPRLNRGRHQTRDAPAQRTY